jgi:hypothetical protein
MPRDQRRHFLSALLSLFGEIGGKNPTGRNLAYCYAQAMMLDHTLTTDILGRDIVPKNSFDKELWDVKANKFPFDGPATGRCRLADLCILYKGKPLAVAEIKVEDQNEDDPTGQLKDYVAFAKQQKIPFHYITKYTLTISEERKLKGAEKWARRHYEIAAALDKRKDQQIAQMIVEYLKDQKMSGYQPLHARKQDLLTFARRLLPVGYEGHSAKETPYKISQLMEQLLNNTRMIADWMSDGNENRLNVTVYPTVETYWRVGDLVKECTAKPGQVKELKGYIADYFKSGILYFVAEARFGKKARMWLSVSQWIELEGYDRINQGILIEVEGGPLGALSDDKKWRPWVEKRVSLNNYTEAKMRADLKTLIKGAQSRLGNLRKHPSPEIKRFAKSAGARCVAETEFRGIA